MKIVGSWINGLVFIPTFGILEKDRTYEIFFTLFVINVSIFITKK